MLYLFEIRTIFCRYIASRIYMMMYDTIMVVTMTVNNMCSIVVVIIIITHKTIMWMVF